MRMNNKYKSINTFTLLLDTNYKLNKREDKMNDDSAMITHPMLFIDFAHHGMGLNMSPKRSEKYYRYINRKKKLD